MVKLDSAKMFNTYDTKLRKKDVSSPYLSDPDGALGSITTMGWDSFYKIIIIDMIPVPLVISHK